MTAVQSIRPLLANTRWRLHKGLLGLGLAVLASAASADVRVSGADTLESFFNEVLAQYSRGPGANVPATASYKGTTAGLRDLCGGRANVAPASSRFDLDIARRCEQAGLQKVELPLALDAVAVITHPSRAPVGEFSMAELKTLFAPESAGKVTRWNQVRPGLPDAPLVVVSLDPRSGTAAFFGAAVHGARGFVRSDAKVTADHAEVIRLVAADPNAVGFVSLGALTKARAAVWKAPINFGKGPVTASRETMAAGGAYASLARTLYAYTTVQALTAPDGHVLAFSKLLLERAPALATQEGFLPLTDQDYRDALLKVQPPR
jgi:phosphate transport system substrate-binding protein